MLATALAALPLVVLVAFSSVDRYHADHARAETRASNRAELIARLLATDGPRVPPAGRLADLLHLGASTPGTAAVVIGDGRVLVRAGSPGAGPAMDEPALARRRGVFKATGPDGVLRVWGLQPIGTTRMTLAFGLPGSAVYGEAQAALRRDLLLAALCVAIAVFASFLLAGRVTAPIRRLAASVGEHEGGNEVGAIERRIARDLDERDKLEERLRQAEKMESIGQLAGGIAHDFNNLLTVITGYAELARRELSDEAGKAELAEIQRAADRAASLTRQLLAFARKQRLDPQPLDLSAVIAELGAMLERLIGEDIRIATLLADGLPAVLADRAQLEQVIINLAVNARDAMPQGGTLTFDTRTARLHARVAAEQGVTPGDYVCMTVTDTGTGIPAEQLEHIFEPFYTTKEIGHGTGLGLSTVDGIVRQSGGGIQVYSEPVLGTTFKVYLPVADAAVAAEEPVQRPAARRASGTVLVCEDDDGIRALLELMLSGAGYRVLTAPNPDTALELARLHDGDIDLLVSDVILPRMSGPELARRLELPDLPVLFLSGYTFETVRGRGQLPVGSAFLEKPFSEADLLAHVREMLARTTSTS
jgi:signal transduction histidine kinase